MRDNETPLDLDALDDEREQVLSLMAGSGELDPELQRRLVRLVLQMAAPLSQITDQVDELIGKVSSSGEDTVSKLWDPALPALFLLFNSVWTATTRWGCVSPGNFLAEGQQAHSATLGKLSRLADKIDDAADQAT